MSSDSTASGVAFFSPSFSISRFHPNAQTINPPPTWTAGSDTPKKASRCEPRKYEPAIKAKLFKVTRQDSSRRVVGRDTPRQRQEDRAGAERVHDWEQRAENQEKDFYFVVHTSA